MIPKKGQEGAGEAQIIHLADHRKKPRGTRLPNGRTEPLMTAEAAAKHAAQEAQMAYLRRLNHGLLQAVKAYDEEHPNGV